MEKEIRQIYENLHGILTKADYAIPWIKELKAKGYQVLVLSNFSSKVARENPDALEFLEYVDGGILSYQDGVIKPDPAIYRLLLDRYSLNPRNAFSWTTYRRIWTRRRRLESTRFSSGAWSRPGRSCARWG